MNYVSHLLMCIIVFLSVSSRINEYSRLTGCKRLTDSEANLNKFITFIILLLYSPVKYIVIELLLKSQEVSLAPHHLLNHL